MLRKIKFSHYKGFKEEQTLELRPVTVIFGKNSSGKSSVLKMLSMLSSAVNSGGESELSLKPAEGVSLGLRFNDLFYNHILSDLRFELDYDKTTLSTGLVVNDGELQTYRYNAVNKEKGKEFTIDKPCAGGLYVKDALSALDLPEVEVQFGVKYIGPIRVQAPSSIDYASALKSTYVGVDGGKTYSILLYLYQKDEALFSAISNWMKQNMDGQELVIDDSNPSSGICSLMVRRNGVDVNISDVGQGISQVLPIVTQSFLKSGGDTIIEVEQPALHLHPSVHANVAYRMAESAKALGHRYVVESHSENFLLGLRKIVADKNTSVKDSDVVIYYVHSEAAPFWLEEIHINPEGSLTSWPTGVFAEGFELMNDISDLQG